MKLAVKQLSISLENKPGMLSWISEMLGKEGVNIRAISVADTSDISTVRFVVDDPVKAVNILKTNNHTVKETDVLAVETPDHPGGLGAVLKPIKAADINVLYLYPYLGRASNQAIVILGVDMIDEAENALRENWVHMFGDEIYNM
ncbi:MAG: ACT domain-containing protein [Halobacteriota archaeon]|nr:ACT domain-containing protein [Halobacteriota archaeon]